MLNYLKNIWLRIQAAAVLIGLAAAGVFWILFLYEKNKAITEEAQLKEEKLNEDLAKDNEVIDKNNQDLKIEAAKRAELETKKNENEEVPLSTIVTDLNNRK